MTAFPALSSADDGDISLDDYGAIRRWLDRVRKLNRFDDLLEPG